MKFSIRDLLWLTALAALGICWWLDHHRQKRRIEDLEETVQWISPTRPPHVLDSLEKPP
ncbi:MAG TPA: hypothetical protein VMP01_14545 [Pirellulaceae bacterium]|nr:hypothetical protein [Pirellulaceae bacterium]